MYTNAAHTSHDTPTNMTTTVPTLRLPSAPHQPEPVHPDVTQTLKTWGILEKGAYKRNYYNLIATMMYHKQDEHSLFERPKKKKRSQVARNVSQR